MSKEKTIEQLKLVAGAIRPHVKIDTGNGKIEVEEGALADGLKAIDEGLDSGELKRYQEAEQIFIAASKVAIAEEANTLARGNKDIQHLNGKFDVGSNRVAVTYDREVRGRTPGENGKEYVRHGTVETRQTPTGGSSHFRAAKELLIELGHGLN